YTYTYTDCASLEFVWTYTYTVEDTTAPSIDPEASDLTVECDGLGNAAQLAAWLATNGGAAASDICCGPNVTWTNNFTALVGACGATGSVEVTFTATDCCGNSSDTIATFTIEDTTAPGLTVPADLTLECGEAGNQATYEVWLASATATDTCGTVAIAHSGLTFAGLPIENALGVGTVVAWTATDACGNETTDTAVIKLLDTIAPAITIQVPSNARMYDLDDQVWVSWVVVEEGSGIELLEATQPSGAYLDTAAAGRHAFQVSAVDVVGNSSSESLIYQVEFEIVLPELGEAGIPSFLDRSTGADGAEPPMYGDQPVAAIYGMGETISIAFQILNAAGLPIPDMDIQCAMFRVTVDGVEETSRQVLAWTSLAYDAGYAMSIATVDDRGAVLFEPGYYDIWLMFPGGMMERIRIQMVPGEA
ncbi:hypothetical protein JW848_10475, partial [Candidatus Bipolaricaulota bacterium]|nr:hypothetical protein [Candidatus Bipolaricaulota bacterium]